ncbi:hypothetical protein SCUP234_10461 [Seiridium cupressi]
MLPGEHSDSTRRDSRHDDYHTLISMARWYYLQELGTLTPQVAAVPYAVFISVDKVTVKSMWIKYCGRHMSNRERSKDRTGQDVPHADQGALSFRRPAKDFDGVNLV